MASKRRQGNRHRDRDPKITLKNMINRIAETLHNQIGQVVIQQENKDRGGSHQMRNRGAEHHIKRSSDKTFYEIKWNKDAAEAFIEIRYYELQPPEDLHACSGRHMHYVEDVGEPSFHRFRVQTRNGILAEDAADDLLCHYKHIARAARQKAPETKPFFKQMESVLMSNERARA